MTLVLRSDRALQGIAVGEDMVNLKYTTASAVKEKEGKLMCQAEVLCEGKTLEQLLFKLYLLTLCF